MVDTTVMYALLAAPDFFQVEGQLFLDLREGRPLLQLVMFLFTGIFFPSSLITGLTT